MLLCQKFQPWVLMILILSKVDTRQSQSLSWDQGQNLINKKMAGQGLVYGQPPTFMPPHVIENLASQTENPCIAKLRQGLNVFGLARIMQKFPNLLHLLRHNNHALSAKMVLKFLVPKNFLYIKGKGI